MISIVAPILLAFIATCQGQTIRLPVLTNAISGFFPPSGSWGLCKSEQSAFHGIVQSNKDCAMEKLMSICEFSRNDAERLLRLANSVISRHPFARGPAVGADKGAKKCMCKVASECKCKIAQDWCSNRNLKKKAKNATDKKKKNEEKEEKKPKAAQKKETSHKGKETEIHRHEKEDKEVKEDENEEKADEKKEEE